jgi:hypothetical protein
MQSNAQRKTGRKWRKELNAKPTNARDGANATLPPPPLPTPPTPPKARLNWLREVRQPCPHHFHQVKVSSVLLAVDSSVALPSHLVLNIEVLYSRSYPLAFLNSLLSQVLDAMGKRSGGGVLTSMRATQQLLETIPASVKYILPVYHLMAVTKTCAGGLAAARAGCHMRPSPYGFMPTKSSRTRPLVPQPSWRTDGPVGLWVVG